MKPTIIEWMSVPENFIAKNRAQRVFFLVLTHDKKYKFCIGKPPLDVDHWRDYSRCDNDGWVEKYPSEVVHYWAPMPKFETP